MDPGFGKLIAEGMIFAQISMLLHASPKFVGLDTKKTTFSIPMRKLETWCDFFPPPGGFELGELKYGLVSRIPDTPP